MEVVQINMQRLNIWEHQAVFEEKDLDFHHTNT